MLAKFVLHVLLNANLVIVIVRARVAVAQLVVCHFLVLLTTQTLRL